MYIIPLYLRSSSAINLTLFILSTTGLIASATAQELNPQQSATDDSSMPIIYIVGERQDGFSTQVVSSTKSDKSLFETPQSISVVTRTLMDARQVSTLDEAIETVAGVTSATYGRRGWDDFSIRGQNAVNTMYLDGLRIGQDNAVAQEVFGAERVEVVKGPASIYFGQVTPGGTVNIVSKRPISETFNQAGLTLGSDGLTRGTFDFGRPLSSENAKAAVRINGMVMNSDDHTDGVWFKNRYIAPSISLDFGERTDFTILAAINQRNYVRQQGLPTAATPLVNNGVSISRDFFNGDSTVEPYNADQKSIGYGLTHRFDSGWTFNQTYRHIDMDVTGQIVNTAGAPDDSGNFKRNVLDETYAGRSDSIDSNIGKTFIWAEAKHNVMIGFDAMYDKFSRDALRCAIASQNIYAPVYGKSVTACGPQNDSASTNKTLSQNGLYIRDYIEFNEQFGMSLSLRHDEAKLKTEYPLQPAETALTNMNMIANTGHIGITYKATQNVAPYVSYATSFMPQTGTRFDGKPLEPEEGKQSELGVKFLSDDKRLSANLAYYNLTRRNLTQVDDFNPGFQVAIGEQTTKGYEAELSADLNNGWQLSAALSILDAVITEASDSQVATVGEKLSLIPRKTANILANYQFEDTLKNWGVGAGIRYVGSKTTNVSTIVIPSYAVTDANISYKGQGYQVQLNIKNIFDKDYFAGAANKNWAALGNPRTVMLKTTFDF